MLVEVLFFASPTWRSKRTSSRTTNTEPFYKLVSFVISEAAGGPEYCGWFSLTPDDHPDVLMKYLCEIGMTTSLAAQVLTQTAQSAAVKGGALTDVEFADVLAMVMGQDAVPAFQSAGILP